MYRGLRYGRHPITGERVRLAPLGLCFDTPAEGAGAGASGGGSAQGGANQGAQGGANNNQGAGAQQQRRAGDDFLTGGSYGLPDGAITGFRNLLTRFQGDGVAAAAHLYDENHRLRQSRREPTAEDARKILEAAGFKVLTKEEGATYDGFTQLGKFEDVKKKVAEHGTLTQEKQQRLYDDLITEAAGLHGYKPKLLNMLVGAQGLNLITEEVDVQQQDGSTKKEKRAFVVTKNAQGHEQKTQLDSYLTTNFKDEEPALKADASGQQQPAGGAQSAGGVTWPKQPVNSGGGTRRNQAADYINRTYQGPTLPGQQQAAAGGKK